MMMYPRLMNQTAALAHQTAKKDEKIRTLESDVAARAREAATLRQTHQELTSRIEELKTEVKQRDTKITKLESSLTAKDDQLATLHEELTSASEQVAVLSEELDSLREALSRGGEKAEATVIQALQNQMRKARRQFRAGPPGDRRT